MHWQTIAIRTRASRVGDGVLIYFTTETLSFHSGTRISTVFHFRWIISVLSSEPRATFRQRNHQSIWLCLTIESFFLFTTFTRVDHLTSMSNGSVASVDSMIMHLLFSGKGLLFENRKQCGHKAMPSSSITTRAFGLNCVNKQIKRASCRVIKMFASFEDCLCVEIKNIAVTE